MSHVATVKAYVTDLDALDSACKAIGLELVRGATNYKWYGKWVGDYAGGQAAVSNGYDPATFGTCEHKVRVKGSGSHVYEIGLVRRADGGPGWDMVYDNWCGGNGLEAVAGAGLKTLKRELAAVVATKQLQKMGMRATRRVDARTGNIIVTGR